MKSRFACGLIVLALLSTGLTGCWDSRSIDELAVVMATALDYTEEGNIMASSQIAVPTSVQTEGGSPQSGAGAKGFTVVSAVGKNVHDAMDELQRKLSRKLFIEHRKVLLIGEELAKQGLKDTLDHFSRDPDSRLQTYLLIAKNARAVELLLQAVPFEKVPTRAVRSLQEINAEITTTLREMFTAMSGEEIVPTVGALELVEGTAGAGVSTGKDESSRMMTFRLAGSAVIKDYKLAGYLDMEQTRGLLWVLNENKRVSITGNVPGKGNVVMELDKTGKKIKTHIRDGKVQVDISVTTSGPVHENNTDLDLSDPNNIVQIEEALSNSIKGSILKVSEVSQNQLKADIFGVGREIYRHNPGQWKRLKDRWADTYPEAEISVSSSVTITRTGMYGKPLHLIEEKE
ncbi:Ger(x)C family spore germination protein [Paenibacillus typhae]|uniref:Ger(x)C family spore germination protein n=1 Tax=Paenibacillus typhae TaxID=1174501 RepID=UPI001C8EA8D2|nr:Ger(x)C family spore germination protein [Paenibacillus typhae]MBY0009589.1 Ger(x)C family spore germination protein [Paenibacillus typhae]